MPETPAEDLIGSPFLYPVALDVRGRRCVVVGAGAVGARKARALADAGGDVLFVSPQAGGEARALCDAGRAAHSADLFQPAHLDDAFVCVAATDRPDVNDAVARAARERGVLLNLAAAGEDEGEAGAGGDFATMATLRRGDLLLSVTTGGAGPALAGRLRRDLEEAYGASWADYVALLGEMRRRAKQAVPAEQRAAALRRLASSEAVRSRALSGDLDGARREAIACLS